MNHQSSVLQQFQTSQSIWPRTIAGIFDELLNNEINITSGTRSMASRSQTHLREFLANESKRDQTFPRVLSTADSDFLGGSFDRHTKNWPLDDIDVYFPLDGLNLFYYQDGLMLPYTVATDHAFLRPLLGNPLLTPRWTNGSLISSAKLINEFARVLRRHYPGTDVKPNGQAVSIKMSQGATLSGDGLGYDVVPCFSLKPCNPNEWPFYLMPDGLNGWIRTNPRIDSEMADYLHRNNSKIYRKVVKLIKYWNSTQLKGALGSYYIELAIARIFNENNKRGEYINSISFGLALGFFAVNQAVQEGNQTAWIPNAPPVEAGLLNISHYSVLRNTALLVRLAWDHEQNYRLVNAFDVWSKIFGDKFPTL